MLSNIQSINFNYITRAEWDRVSLLQVKQTINQRFTRNYKSNITTNKLLRFSNVVGFKGEKQLKVIEPLAWEENFIRNCKDLEEYYEWVPQVLDVVKGYGRKLPRNKFIDQFNRLKIIDKILLSPSQIDQFKKNLKVSVLLSYGQALKPPRPKQNSRIQSIMSSTSKKNQNLVISHSFSNSSSVSPKKKGQGQYDRRDSILSGRSLRQSFSRNRSGFRDSILTFVDDTMATLFRGQQKQISKKSAHSLQTFLKFSLILQKHLNHKDNIIHKIISNFESYIYKQYTIFSSQPKDENEKSEIQQQEKQVMKLEQIQQKWKKVLKKDKIKQLQNRKSLTQQQLEELTTDIKMFLIVLRQIVQDYYKTSQFVYQLNELQTNTQTIRNLELLQRKQSISSMSLNTNNLISSEDNILILVTAILFKNQKFHNHIFNIFKKYHEDREKQFKIVLERLSNRPPQYFQVRRQYCLNEYLMEKFSEDKKISQKQKQIEDQTNGQLQVLKSSSNLNLSHKQSLISNSKYPKPYQNCCQILKRLGKCKTPTSKMKVIMECSQKITQTVSQFYNTHNIQLKNDVLDADQVLSIFCYILANNPVEHLHANLFMIENFATENQMISVTGYYYSVLTIAIQQLQNMYASTVVDLQSSKGQIYESRAQSVKTPIRKNARSMHKGKNPKREKIKRSFNNQQ